MKKVIGIISYLPNDEKIRKARKERIINLIEQCNFLFKLPIIIIAQNWDNNIMMPNNVNLYKFEKLGITGARKKLREIFLNSDYDYLIMLDDDCSFSGNLIAAENYLNQIDQHPGMYGKFKGTLLKLFAISKEMYSLVDYPDLEPERGEIFEDIFIVSLLEKKYPDKSFQFIKTNLEETSLSIGDTYSTWYQKGWNRHDIGDKTRALLKEM